MNEEPNSVVDDEESDDDDDDDDEKLPIEVVREAEEGPVIVKPIRVIDEEKTRVDREGREMSAGELEERNPDRESRDEEDHYRMKSSFQFATDDDGEEMTLTQRHLWLWRLIKWVRDAAKERVHSYYWRHLAAWTVLTLLFSGPLYATGKGRIPYIDSLFYTASALTGTGLATRDVSDENIGTQVLLFLLMTVSGPVVESLIPPVYRLLLFRRQMQRLQTDDPDVMRNLLESKTRLLWLMGVIAVYIVALQLLGFLVMGLYLQISQRGADVMHLNGVNGWWWSLFQAVSAFHNCGLGLIADSTIQLNQQLLPLAVSGALVLLGNNFFPVVLRAILRLLHFVLSRTGRPSASIIAGLLKRPRDHSAYLYSTKHTFMLLSVIVAFIAVQTILMCALDGGTPAFAGLNAGYTFANALFQSTSPRASGITSIPIGFLHVESLILFIAMMYVSAYPIVVMLLSTNEEQDERSQTAFYHLRNLVFVDALWVLVPWYLVSAIETYDDYSLGFSALFEIVSAYGTVGLSLGLSCCTYSFSGSLSLPSKLVVIVTMLVGRHRGLPDQFDTALALLGTPRLFEVKSRHSKSS